jgi:hypothetical protein
MNLHPMNRKRSVVSFRSYYYWLWAASTIQNQRAAVGNDGSGCGGVGMVTALSYSSLPLHATHQQQQHEQQHNNKQRQRYVYVTTYGDTGNSDDPNNVHDHDPKWTEVAQQIANDLNLPFWDPTLTGDHFHDDDDDDHDDDYFHRCTHVLDVIPYGDTYALGIRQQKQQKPQKQQKHHPGYRSLRRTAGSQTPYIVDFCPSPHSRIAKRIQSTSSGSSSDLLIKAVAPHKIKRNEGQGGARIWDLTAGFGQDSLLMLEHGASEVCMVERDPIVAALLQDALRRRERIMTDATIATAIRTGGHGSGNSSSRTKKLSLWVGNGLDMIQSAMAMAAPQHNDHHEDDKGYHDHHPRLPVDVCYLDPMFPPRTKSAAVKKNMQILHSLLESQQQPQPPTLPTMDNDVNHDDPLALLEAALLVAQSRVVVKRPIHAPPLGHDSTTKNNSQDTSSSSRTGPRVPKPSFEICGSVNRFDVYVTQS